MRNAPLILIADDEPGFIEIVASKLKRNGFLVSEAHDGKEAVEKAVNLHPDLIVMDINMPGETGTEAVLDLMRDKENKNIKVIFFTSMKEPWPGLKGEPHEKVARDLGAAGFIDKSEDLDKIVEKIKALLKVTSNQ